GLAVAGGGGPCTVVREPRSPAVMSRAIRGRSMSQSGMLGTVTLDARSGSPTPAVCRPVPTVAAMAALVAIAITFSHRRARGRPPPRGPVGANRALPAHGLARVPEYCLARTRVTRRRPAPISPRVTPGPAAGLASVSPVRGGAPTA